MKTTRVFSKQLSPEIFMVWAWEDMREIGYLTADDQYPHCCTYYNGILVSNLYWNPDTVTTDNVKHWLETCPIHKILGCNKCEEKI